MYGKGREFFRYYVIKDVFCTYFGFIMAYYSQQNTILYIIKVIVFGLTCNEHVRTVGYRIFYQECTTAATQGHFTYRLACKSRMLHATDLKEVFYPLQKNQLVLFFGQLSHYPRTDLVPGIIQRIEIKHRFFVRMDRKQGACNRRFTKSR